MSNFGTLCHIGQVCNMEKGLCNMVTLRYKANVLTFALVEQ